MNSLKKTDLRLAQPYALMPDSPSECDLSAFTDIKIRQTLRLVPVQPTACIQPLQQFLLLSNRIILRLYCDADVLHNEAKRAVCFHKDADLIILMWTIGRVDKLFKPRLDLCHMLILLTCSNSCRHST